MLDALQKVSSIVTTLLVAALVVYGASYFVKTDDRPELDWYRYILATRATEKFAADLPRLRDVEKVMLVPVVRDSLGTKQNVTAMLAERVRNASKYSLVTGEALDSDLREEFRKNPPTRPRDACRYAAALGADGALLVSLEEFEPGRGGRGASIKLEGAIYDAKTGALIDGTQTRYDQRVEGLLDPDFFAAYMHESSGGWRLLLWALVTGLLPVATAPLAIEVMRRERNAWNAALVLAYTAFDGLFGLFLTGFYVHAAWLGGMLALGVATALVYNYVALDRVDELRK